MPRRHRSHSTEFKRQVVAEYHVGETLHALGRRHDVLRKLIRTEKAEAGALDEDAAAAESLTGYEARVAALESLVGRQALEIEFLKGGYAPDPRRKAQTYLPPAACQPLDPAGLQADGCPAIALPGRPRRLASRCRDRGGFLAGQLRRNTPPEPAQMLTLPDWRPTWRG
ncbi:transposase [Meridianimarinicoccus roseus]|uniref:transposase n=1 Tax=Meridianimarinicoccus roseus TaxID=2072018 RepID=UPI001EE64AD4|nr:transposase [Meridianimarinicoccus roseus]